MAQRGWPVVFVTSLLICLSLACASVARAPIKPTATVAAATATPAAATAVSGAPGPDETTTDTPTTPPSATSTPNATVAASATPTEDLGATVTAVGNQSGLLGHTGPSDIPVISNATRIETATDMLVVYQTSADAATIIKFYMDQMPPNGWTVGSTTQLKEPPTTTMTFTKGNREAAVSLVDPAGAKQVLVSIVITGK